ncbi:WD40 repeat-like protein [Anaeromyces robustus]|uniref:WD40 repeat-like protein n=1 Tax=Anaeromyces robustus TaxID=1754192 RepID=A0A1Y1WPJ3_9FUNG|nr:WD40 repeat-like protein [Anaeromyces robustus]|eukprot:ORX75402.1 WD40 repeat-like protein [Anaeromyces robustus]
MYIFTDNEDLLKSKISIQKRSFKQRVSREYKGHRQKVHTVGWNIEGKKLASGSVDQTARVWNIERSSSHRDCIELKGHTGSVDQLCWDPTHSEYLATASADKTVRIWDSRAGKCIHVIPTSGENINICWSPDGKQIAVGNKEDLISFIDTRTHKVVNTKQNDIEVNEISWNYGGDKFFLTSGQGTIEVLEYPSLKELKSIQAHTANCYCLEFDPNGRYLATGSADTLVSLWEVEDLTCIRTFGNLNWPVRTISFSHDGEYLASASEDLFIDISNVETGEQVHKIECNAAMNSLAWHPSKYLLAYAGDELDNKIGIVRVFGFSPSS